MVAAVGRPSPGSTPRSARRGPGPAKHGAADSQRTSLLLEQRAVVVVLVGGVLNPYTLRGPRRRRESARRCSCRAPRSPCIRRQGGEVGHGDGPVRPRRPIAFRLNTSVSALGVVRMSVDVGRLRCRPELGLPEVVGRAPSAPPGRSISFGIHGIMAGVSGADAADDVPVRHQRLGPGVEALGLGQRSGRPRCSGCATASGTRSARTARSCRPSRWSSRE